MVFRKLQNFNECPTFVGKKGVDFWKSALAYFKLIEKFQRKMRI